MKQEHFSIPDIRVIIGLGNPERRHYYQRHSIGFRVLDVLAHEYGAQWLLRDNSKQANITVGSRSILLIKPQTYMNASGKVIPAIIKKGIKPEQLLVVHDDLELSFGTIKFRVGGSHKGHNGLKSIIAVCGPNFARLRFGIGRPVNKDDVPDYVLQPFDQPVSDVDYYIEQAVSMIKQILIET